MADPHEPSIGAQEGKRASRAFRQVMPLSANWGCAYVPVLVCLASAFIYSGTGGTVPLVFAIGSGILAAGLVPLVVWERLRMRHLLSRARKESVAALVVTSNSPNWQEHIEKNWLARMGKNVRVLNWSDRAKWDKGSLEAGLFHYLVGVGHSKSDHNPVVVVLQGSDIRVFRFYFAFHQVKAGRPHYLEQLETEMFQALEKAGETGR